MKQNIQCVSDSYLCSNCGACKSICAKNAISFKVSSMGRMYASVNDDCTDCGLCQKVCPSLNPPNLLGAVDPYVGIIRSVYTGRAVDAQLFRNAQSGGAVTATLFYLFKTGRIDAAIVCKMSADKTPKIESVVIENPENLALTQKSCYTPVEMLSILRQVRDKGSVAFVGLPCHIQGLTLLQKMSKRYSNIKYKIGLICDRTLCSTIQDVFTSIYQQSNKSNVDAIKIDWRRKNFVRNNCFYSYKDAPVVVYSPSHEQVIPNLYRFALKEMFTPPRCRICPDKINISADIVCGDPWRLEGINWEEGESVIVTRTDMAEKLVLEMQAENILTLTERENFEICKSQLIDDRKRSVAKYCKIVKGLALPELKSYLYGNDILDNKINIQEYQIIERFINNEAKSKEVIVDEALNEIKIAIKRQKFDNNPLVKQLRVFKSKVKSLITK